MPLQFIKIYAVRVLTEYYAFKDNFTKYFVNIVDAYDYLGTITDTILKIPVQYSFFVFVEDECAIQDGDKYFMVLDDVISVL